MPFKKAKKPLAEVEYNHAYRFRLYPTKEQREFISKAVGCVRFVYNYMLYHAKENYRVYGYKWDNKAYIGILPMVKEEYPFLKEALSQSLQNAVDNLDAAFRDFFKGKSGYPNFKRKRNGGKFYIPQGFAFNGNKLYIPKLKDGIKVKEHRKVNGIIKSVTIEKTPSGKYYASVLAVSKKPKPLPKTDSVCGIDVGIHSLAVITKGNGDSKEHIVIDNPKHLAKSQKRLARLQRQLSRKQHPTAQNKAVKPSNNFIKHSRKVARLHEKVANQRADFLHKFSKAVVDENQVIAVENLNTKGMLKNHSLAKSISDASWGKLIELLEYKAKLAGRILIKADRFYASSKNCSVCGYKKADLKLSDREWTCPVCNTHHDRDINASENLYAIARTKYASVYGNLAYDYLLGQVLPEVTPVETSSADDRDLTDHLKSAPSVKQEARAAAEDAIGGSADG